MLEQCDSVLTYAGEVNSIHNFETGVKLLDNTSVILHHSKYDVIPRVEYDGAHVQFRYSSKQMIRPQVPHLRGANYLQPITVEGAVDDRVKHVKFVNLHNKK